MDSNYSIEWFKQRAFESLQKIEDGVWDYSDSSLIYVPNDEDLYETIQDKENPYYRIVTEPERRYIQSISPSIARHLPSSFEFIDLGPGTEHKEQYLFNTIKRFGKHFTYLPVDINEKYLAMATQHAKQQGLPVQPIHSSFEDLPNRLPQQQIYRFVSIGLTYTNYHPTKILPLLRKVVGNQGSAFINCQMRERVALSEIVRIYEKEVYNLLEPKIKLLGLSTEDVGRRWCDDGIRAWFSIIKVSPELAHKGVREEDKLLAYYFLRPSFESLKNDVMASFSSPIFFDTNGPFVATLLM